jgi:hemerythrin
MQHIEWNDNLRIGVKEVDEQHFNLVRIVNAVIELDKKEELGRSANKIIYTLLSFAKYHFRTEESLMDKHNYPEYHIHKMQHDDLLKEISRIHEMTEQGQEVDFYPVYNFLNQWFLNHTKKYDEGYVPFFVEKGIAKEVKKSVKSKEYTKKQLTLGRLSLIDWEDGFDLGIPDIDSQHRNLVYAVNLLYSTLGKPMNKSTCKNVEEAFKELKRYANEHFNREEGLMEKCGYSDLIIHRLEHDNFKQQIMQAKKRYDKHKTIVDHDLVIMLRDWFMNHAQIEDRKYLGSVNTDDVQLP